MNITFLIGNGFDLNLGLKTTYKDFLSYYLSDNHEGSLTNAIKQDIETWANLEEQLGIYAGKIKEDDVDQFISEKEELDNSLLKYLTMISKQKLRFDSVGATEFRDNVAGFYNKLPIIEKERYDRVIKSTTESIYYCFIDFNYTLFLDTIIENAKKINPFSSHTGGTTGFHDYIQSPLHIHGTVNDEMILGVNDKSQLQTGQQEPHSYLANYLVKPNVNRLLGNQKNPQAQSIIDKSRYICVYGMSLGMTDKDWWVHIGNWLQKSTENRLILFMHDTSGASPIGGKAARMQDIVRRRFLGISGKLQEFEKINQQIIVRFNSDIFTFEHINLEEKR